MLKNVLKVIIVLGKEGEHQHLVKLVLTGMRFDSLFVNHVRKRGIKMKQACKNVSDVQ